MIGTTVKTGLVTDKMKSQYQEEGYMILERVIPEDILQMLREECSYFLGYYDAQMDAAKADTDGISHRGRRYFVANRYRLSQRMRNFIFSPIMAEIAQAALGPDVYLFHEQWVVKSPEKGMKFAWHQDSGYVNSDDSKTTHKPYLTCWCPIDDVNEDNGTVFLLPHSRGGTSHTIFDHEQEEGSGDLVGYHGDDPGIPIEVPAGSVVAFTSFNFHRSGANTSKNMRRVHLPQYSSEPIMKADGTEPWALTVPFVRNGKIVYSRDEDTAEKYGGMPGI
jgi:ectoine hydroxylase-related dioxygenase (phytanoyl-CoA dioxygenase family)